jgi:hypothetical protein
LVSFELFLRRFVEPEPGAGWGPGGGLVGARWGPGGVRWGPGGGLYTDCA